MAETKLSQPQRTLAQRYMECKRIIEDTFITDSCIRQRIVTLRKDFLKEMLGGAYNLNWLQIFTRVAGQKGGDEEFAFNTVQWLYVNKQNPGMLLSSLVNIKKEETLNRWLKSLRTQ